MTKSRGLIKRSALVSASASLALLLVPGTGIASAATKAGSAGMSLHAARNVGPAALPANISVVATGLNQPRRVTIGPDGNLYVTEAGVNSAPAGCTDGSQAQCANPSGAIAKVTLAGHVTPLVTGLPSVNNGGAPGVTGPSGITIESGHIQSLIQNQNINATTGAESYGTAGAPLGDLLSTPLSGGTASAATVEAQMGPYEARNNPDHGAGAGGPESPIDSDPYAVVAYHGGLAIADAAGNDILLYKHGTRSTLAVLPLLNENGGKAQAVPTSLAVGPDGNLYIGELGGVESGNDVGISNVYKLVNGHLVTVASGFTMIGDIAFDQAGRLMVLEMDQMGLEDPSPLPAPGELIRVNLNGTRTVLASTGLEFPSGMAVAKDGSIYLTNWSILQGSHDPNLPPGFNAGGEIVRVADSSTTDQIGANYGGYREVAQDGGVFDFGAFPSYGSLGGVTLAKPVVSAVDTPLGPGYWMVAGDGGVFTFGTARFEGSAASFPLNKPIVTITPTPDGKGYYLFASDGGVFTFGDATFHGSLGDVKLAAPIVAAATTPDGGGYWLFGSDGGVFTFGDATFHGSMGATKLAQPVKGGAATPDGKGYYLFASDGGVFTFGDATFHGSMGATKLVQPVVNGQITPNNGGYRMVASDGGVFDFGNAVYYGSMGGQRLNKPIVSLG